MKKIVSFILFIAFVSSSYAENNQCWWRKNKNELYDSVNVNINGQGLIFNFDFVAGKSHNNPSFAIWIEDINGKFVQDLFVTNSVATGIFRYGDSSTGKWEAGERRYRAALPYYFHKRTGSIGPSIPSTNQPVPDAYTGATPKKNFLLKTKSDTKPNSKFRIVIEINQTWDFNKFWYNAKFPEDSDYRTSAQPSLIYSVIVDTKDLMDEYYFNPIGHGHYSGADGRLYTDLSTITSALEIFNTIRVVVTK